MRKVPPPMRGHGPHFDPRTATTVHKRSFQRACKRAIQFGTASYHGRQLHLHDFPTQLIQRLQASQPLQTVRSLQPSSRKLTTPAPSCTGTQRGWRRVPCWSSNFDFLHIQQTLWFCQRPNAAFNVAGMMTPGHMSIVPQRLIDQEAFW